MYKIVTEITHSSLLRRKTEPEVDILKRIFIKLVTKDRKETSNLLSANVHLFIIFFHCLTIKFLKNIDGKIENTNLNFLLLNFFNALIFYFFV